VRNFYFAKSNSLSMLVFDAAPYAQPTAGAHSFVIQATALDMPLVIDAAPEGMGLGNSRMRARLGCAKDTESGSSFGCLSFLCWPGSLRKGKGDIGRREWTCVAINRRMGGRVRCLHIYSCLHH